MKYILLISFVLINLTSFSKTSWISVNDIFDSTINVIDMQIIGYENDTVLNYLDLIDNKIKRVICKYKASSYVYKRDTSLNPIEASWYGEFPEKGEFVKMIVFKHGSVTRYVFAKQIGDHVKIWYPLNILFAKYLFMVSKDSIYLYPKFCFEFKEKAIVCDDFYMKEEDFEREIEM